MKEAEADRSFGEGERLMAANLFSITRTIAAPRDLVFRAHIEIEHLKHWWGPKGLTMMKCTVDLRPGGLFHYGMKAPDGSMMWGRWVFREISTPEKLSYVVSFSDENGGITRHPMAPNWPAEMLSTAIFTEKDGKTTIVLTVEPLNTSDAERKIFEDGFDSMKQGFGGTYDQLDAYLTTICKPQPVIPYLTVKGAEYSESSAPQAGQVPPVAVALNFCSPADVDATFKSALAAGGKGITEPRDEFWGARFAVVADPFGHRWLLNAALPK